MNILVTGGAGYIGSHTCQMLLNAGFKVIVYDNLSTGFRESILPNVELVQGDVCDTKLLTKVLIDHKIDGVVQFAAKLVVPESIEKPLEYYQNNTAGVLSLVEACRDAGVKKVVFSSTAATYGDANGDRPVTENAFTSPLNPYGWSKLMSEQILRDSEPAYGLKSVCLRYFNVAGAAVDGKNGQRTKNATHLIKVSSEAASGKRGGLKVFGTDYPTVDGTCIRDYIHVEDLADLHVLALQYLIAGGNTDTFNCGYGEGYSVKQVVETVKKVSGVNFSVDFEGRRPGDAASLVADSTKIRKAFNWTPKRNDLELICKTAYEWEKSLK